MSLTDLQADEISRKRIYDLLAKGISGEVAYKCAMQEQLIRTSACRSISDYIEKEIKNKTFEGEYRIVKEN